MASYTLSSLNYAWRETSENASGDLTVMNHWEQIVQESFWN